MAYRVTNTSPHYVALTHGAALKPGESRPVHNIGSHELTLQSAGSIRIDRSPREDPNMDDVRYVEIINEDLGSVSVRAPAIPTIVNLELLDKDVWYLVAPLIPNLKSWKAQLRRAEGTVGFEYRYAASGPFMSCLPGEAIFADTIFPSLFVRCPDAAGQILELEYWQDNA